MSHTLFMAPFTVNIINDIVCFTIKLHNSVIFPFSEKAPNGSNFVQFGTVLAISECSFGMSHILFMEPFTVNTINDIVCFTITFHNIVIFRISANTVPNCPKLDMYIYTMYIYIYINVSIKQVKNDPPILRNLVISQEILGI